MKTLLTGSSERDEVEQSRKRNGRTGPSERTSGKRPLLLQRLRQSLARAAGGNHLPSAIILYFPPSNLPQKRVCCDECEDERAGAAPLPSLAPFKPPAGNAQAGY
jgi:hypothetical protein